AIVGSDPRDQAEITVASLQVTPASLLVATTVAPGSAGPCVDHVIVNVSVPPMRGPSIGQTSRTCSVVLAWDQPENAVCPLGARAAHISRTSSSLLRYASSASPAPSNRSSSGQHSHGTPGDPDDAPSGANPLLSRPTYIRAPVEG